MTSSTSDPSGPDGHDAARPAPRWGLLDILGAFVVAQVLSGIAVAIFASVKDIPADRLTDSLSIAEIGLLQMPLWIGLFGVPLWSTYKRGNGPVYDLGWRMVRSDIPVGLGLGVACQLLLVPVFTYPVVWLTSATTDDIAEPARELSDKATGLGVVVLGLVVVIGAPLAEELFYRGMVQRAMLRRLAPWPTMVIVALIFALSHGQPLQFPALAAFGVVLSYLAYRTGRLGLNTWTHVGFNLTTVISLLLTR